ncbi:DUF58 domain-containing protein [Longispora sp. K20-0274]|uniref:DUF58 domain-containing protein n=1 Tax=Longispora sp. K20-0274 TaxID=3088255 RepID=UPI00399BC9A5
MAVARDVDDADWVPTRALRRAVFLTSVLLLAATITGRWDLIVIAAPFAIGAAVSLRNRPRLLPDAVVGTAAPYLTEGGDAEVRVSVANPDHAPYDLAVIRTELSPWLKVPNGDRPFLTPVPALGVVDLDLVGTAERWGRQPVGPLEVYAVACDAMLQSRPIVAQPLLLRVFPKTEGFKADDAMPRAAGLVGAHRSRRYGDGGELAGIRPFSSGDRLRRIDWRTSLRTRELHVAHTLSDRDAEVVLVLDVLHEVEAKAKGARASVLDTTVRAAAGIAQHYLGAGDRVSMLEYGARARWLRPGSGRRHHLAALEWLLDVAPGGTEYDPLEGMFSRHLRSGNALFVVLTPLLEVRSAGLLARLARAGRTVVAVDTLPSMIRPATASEWGDVGYRMWRLERENIIGQLLEHGVPVVPWAGAGSLDQVLRDMSQLAAAPRAGVR